MTTVYTGSQLLADGITAFGFIKAGEYKEGRAKVSGILELLSKKAFEKYSSYLIEKYHDKGHCIDKPCSFHGPLGPFEAPRVFKGGLKLGTIRIDRSPYWIAKQVIWLKKDDFMSWAASHPIQSSLYFLALVYFSYHHPYLAAFNYITVGSGIFIYHILD